VIDLDALGLRRILEVVEAEITPRVRIDPSSCQDVVVTPSLDGDPHGARHGITHEDVVTLIAPVTVGVDP